MRTHAGTGLFNDFEVGCYTFASGKKYATTEFAWNVMYRERFLEFRGIISIMRARNLSLSFGAFILKDTMFFDEAHTMVK